MILKRKWCQPIRHQQSSLSVLNFFFENRYEQSYGPLKSDPLYYGQLVVVKWGVNPDREISHDQPFKNFGVANIPAYHVSSRLLCRSRHGPRPIGQKGQGQFPR